MIGATFTIWTGTAFNCDGNEIVLRHSRFNMSEGAYGECNSGAIVARSMGVEDNCYASELSVRASIALNGRTIHCVLNSNNGMETIDDATISVISGMLHNIVILKPSSYMVYIANFVLHPD